MHFQIYGDSTSTFNHTEPILTSFTIKEVEIKIILTRIYS